MARIRSVHPGQWTDVKFVSCSAYARLLAIGLRNEADDRGVFVWEPVQLKMRLLPNDNVDVPALLDELLKHDQVRKFADESSKEYGVIRNFRRWQRPEKPKILHPLPDNMVTYIGRSPKDGPPNDDSPRPVADKSAKSSPEGSRRRDSEPEDGTVSGRMDPDAEARSVSTHNKSSLQNQVSARANLDGGAGTSSGFGLEGQPSEVQSKAVHPLLQSLRKNGNRGAA